MGEYRRYVMKESLRTCLLNKRGSGGTPAFVRERVLTSEQYSDFMNLYRDFVSAVVLPLFDEPSGEFAIQKEPAYECTCLVELSWVVGKTRLGSMWVCTVIWI